MRFDSGAPPLSPNDEWMARVSPFLLADDPHQVCYQTAQDLGLGDVNLVCACPKPAACDKECCR